MAGGTHKCLIFVTGIVLLTLIIFNYFLFYNNDNIEETVFDTNIIFNWVVHKNDYQNIIYSPKTLPILTPNSSCQNNPLLIIIVCSSVINFKARTAIRNTWSRDALTSGRSEVFFLVGKTTDRVATKSLKEESLKHEDIIQYDFVDNYHNLTLKSVLLLKWVINYCQQAYYVMKVDDDVFLHVSNIMDYLNNIFNPKLLMGTKMYLEKPIKKRNSKWYMTLAEYSKSVYPDYLAGPGYVMGRQAIEILYRNSFRKPFIRMEDIYITGICAKDTELLIEGHELFTNEKLKNDICLYRKMFISHRLSSEELYAIWKNFKNSSIVC